MSSRAQPAETAVPAEPPEFTERAGAERAALAAPAALAGHAVIEQASATLAGLLQRNLSPGLFVVATPIGNLGDITLRALAVLAAADTVLCEDTRHSRILLGHYAIRGRLRPYHEHNAEAERPRVLAMLEAGQRVALICDAGTPLVSDPGYKLVRAAIAAGVPVRVLPGPSSTLAALVVSGLPTDTFHVAGFLPAKENARRARLAQLADIDATLVLLEAPQRVAMTLRAIDEVLGPRQVAVARELTKLHEEVCRGTAGPLAERFTQSPPKGEVVLVVAPPIDASESIADAEIARQLLPLLADMGPSAAARTLAGDLGLAKSRVYAIALAVKAGKDEEPAP